MRLEVTALPTGCVNDARWIQPLGVRSRVRAGCTQHRVLAIALRSSCGVVGGGWWVVGGGGGGDGGGVVVVVPGRGGGAVVVVKSERALASAVLALFALGQYRTGLEFMKGLFFFRNERVSQNACTCTPWCLRFACHRRH